MSAFIVLMFLAGSATAAETPKTSTSSGTPATSNSSSLGLAGPRAEMQSFYLEQEQRRRPLFASAPSHHIIPKQDTISFALQADAVDVTIAPDSTELQDDLSDMDHKLEVKGWSVFPLVAFSADHFGVGFTVEGGSRQIQYLRQDRTSFYEQFSDMSYTGAGLYVFRVFPLPKLSSRVLGTVILGGRSLTCVHVNYAARTNAQASAQAEKLKYDVNAYDIGLNLSMNLVRRFTIFPWLNVRHTVLGPVKDRNESPATDVDDVVEQDRELTWLASRALQYGVDFAVQLGPIEMHFGGVIGYLAGLYQGADRVQDETISFGFSYDI